MAIDDHAESTRRRLSGILGEPVTMEDRGGAWFVGVGHGKGAGETVAGMTTYDAVGWGMTESEALAVAARNYLRWAETHAREKAGTAAEACDFVEGALAERATPGGGDP